jgi:putative peptidoglycan lipid II flippase
MTIAVAVFVGGILQLSFQLPFLRKIDMLVIPRIDFRNSAVWRVVRLMVPAVFAMSISQISLVINTIFASYLPSGSVSWMYYADRLMEFPTGVLGVALGTILLPSLSKHASNKNTLEFSKTMDWGVRLCLLMALPATVGLAITAKELTMTLFMHGKFDLFDVAMTDRALTAYAVGLTGIILVKVFGPGFYANQDIKTPVKIAIFILVITQLLNLLLIDYLKHVGLALSISIGAILNATLLITLLIKKRLYIPRYNFVNFVTKVILATIFMALAIIFSIKYIPLINFSGVIYTRVLSLLIVILIAIKVYFFSLYIFGFRLNHIRL